jgi:hypothetical protein
MTTRFHDQEREDDEVYGGQRSPAAAALVSAAERAADEILAEARADAERMRRESAAEAERLRADAEDEARATVREARETVDGVMRSAEALAEQLQQLGTALHRNAALLLEDVRVAHVALRAEADAAASRLPSQPPPASDDGLDVRITRNRELPFEPPAFEIPPSLRARR